MLQFCILYLSFQLHSNLPESLQCILNMSIFQFQLLLVLFSADNLSQKSGPMANARDFPPIQSFQKQTHSLC